MEKILKLTVAALLLLLVSCGHNSVILQKLEQAEALSYDFDYTSAEKLLNEIDIENINTMRLTAFYNLLKAEIQYRCEGMRRNDSLINISLDYYQHSNDKEHLAAAYYIRALLFFADNSETVLNDLKNAESLIDKIKNKKLIKRIYAGLSVFYGDSDEVPLSLLYARKEYDCAKGISNKKFEAYALLNLSVGYDRSGQKDSAAWCIHECEKFAGLLEPYYQAYMYYGLGSAYSESDSRKAVEYLKKSIELESLPQAYKLLSDIYMATNRAHMAKNLWDEVMRMPWDEFKIGVLDAKLEYESQNHDFEGYRNAQKEKSEAMVRYYEKRLQSKADELGRKYDLNLYRQKVRSHIVITAMAAVLLIVVLVFLHRIRVRRTENKRMKAELDYEKEKNAVVQLDNRIATLQKSKTAEVAALKDKNDKLKAKIQNNLQHGHNLYDQLERCESPINWGDYDLLCLFDFVSTIGPEFILSLDTDYTGLNAQQKLFLIASDFLKKQDHELCAMFNLGKDSLRNKRYRIAKKRVSE